MSHKTSLVVLHKTKLGDSSIVVHGYSSDNGRCGFIIKSNSKRGSLSLLHPLGIIEAEISEKSKGELRFINNFRSLHTLTRLRESVIKNAIAIYISELIFRGIHEYGPSPGFFNFLVKSILLLDAIGDDYANFHLWFLVELSREVGYSPANNYTDGFLFDISSASFVKSAVSGTKCFNREDSALLDTILKHKEESIHILKLNGIQRRSFSKEMTTFLSYHLGCNLNIQSLEILHEVFE